MNKNWPRWLLASVHKHFDANRQGYPVYFESHDRFTDQETDYAEVRIDGPLVRQLTSDEFHLRVEINVLVASKKDQADNHKLYRLAGVFLAAFTPTISVFRYGDGPDDNGTLLGCLRRDEDTRQPVEFHYFGQVDPSAALEQGSITAAYELTV